MSANETPYVTSKDVVDACLRLGAGACVIPIRFMPETVFDDYTQLQILAASIDSAFNVKPLIVPFDRKSAVAYAKKHDPNKVLWAAKLVRAEDAGEIDQEPDHIPIPEPTPRQLYVSGKFVTACYSREQFARTVLEGDVSADISLVDNHPAANHFIVAFVDGATVGAFPAATEEEAQRLCVSLEKVYLSGFRFCNNGGMA